MAIRRTASTIVVLVLCLALVSCEAFGGGGRGHGRVAGPRRPAGPRLPAGVGVEKAFIQTWTAACNYNGRVRIVVPLGVYKLSETVFQGPCKCQAPITFQVMGTLKAVADVSEYSGSGWITFDGITGLILTGGGTFDGQGQAVWKYNDCKENPNCVHLPAAIYFSQMKDTIIRGINLVNSMGFHMHITNSYLFRAIGLHITSPADSPNTDGMHISKSNLVRIVRNVIRTGDDCISIGQGATNVNITKVTCGPGHGISVGSLGKLPNEMDVTGIIVRNCTLVGTTNGLRIKTYPAKTPSRASGILFSNIVMNNVQNPIIIDQGYHTRSTKPSLIKISDVNFENIRGTSMSAVAVNLMCSSINPCQNVRFNNVNLKHSRNLRLTSTCVNARVGYSGFQYPPPCR
ncbi:unnamed protein product [Ilex paraguariensis]|uniref:Exopolygalacturonase n=1 Tax=Ilex paraguariensis TaxID=185542 RepID=A0ABC8V2F7_9AQUA